MLFAHVALQRCPRQGLLSTLRAEKEDPSFAVKSNMHLCGKTHNRYRTRAFCSLYLFAPFLPSGSDRRLYLVCPLSSSERAHSLLSLCLTCLYCSLSLSLPPSLPLALSLPLSLSLALSLYLGYWGFRIAASTLAVGCLHPR